VLLERVDFQGDAWWHLVRTADLERRQPHPRDVWDRHRNVGTVELHDGPVRRDVGRQVLLLNPEHEQVALVGDRRGRAHRLQRGKHPQKTDRVRTAEVTVEVAV